VVEGGGFEIRCGASHPGFESLPLRHLFEDRALEG
jgi:hypothetical protein